MTSAMCFIDMPFGKKVDLSSGVEVDFDQIYHTAIKPAVESLGLEAIRGDEEQTGGIIHAAMFARLLLAEYVVADLTSANPNVFYELGIRHAAKPFTTVPIFATTHALPFDVALIRAVPYQLEAGKLTDDGALELQQAIERRLQQAIDGPVTQDSPLFQLLPEFPGIDLPHDVTDAFQDRVRHESDFSRQLADARGRSSNAERQQALGQIQDQLGDLKVAQRNILVDLMLSYRAVEAFEDMIELIEQLANHVKALPVVQQQWAFALNRRNQGGDRDRAIQLLTDLIDDHGPDPETLGLLGRVHKDRYTEARGANSIMAEAALDDAIAAYRQGFESDPRDYYPGVNAINLLVQKGDAQALSEAEQLLPLVTFAVARRGGASSSDYWDLATVLELACIGKDWVAAAKVLPRVIAADREPWKYETTAANLEILRQALQRQGESPAELDALIAELDKRKEELRGNNTETT